MLTRSSRVIFIAFFMTLAGMAAPASAADENLAEGGYFGMSFVKGTIGFSGAEADSNVLDFRVGNMVNEYVGFEGRFGFGVSDGQVEDCYVVSGFVYCGTADIGIDNYYGVYMRSYMAKPGGFRPYFLLGYSRGKVSVSSGGVSASESEGDISYGFGFDIGNEKAAFTIEYANLFDKDGTEIDGVSIGFLTRF